jgi:hypothetical protein
MFNRISRFGERNSPCICLKITESHLQSDRPAFVPLVPDIVNNFLCKFCYGFRNGLPVIRVLLERCFPAYRFWLPMSYDLTLKYFLFIYL